MKSKLDKQSTHYILRKMVNNRLRGTFSEELYMPFCKKGHKNLLRDWTANEILANNIADNHFDETGHTVTVKIRNH
jgi:hypothetical protein